MIFHHLEHLFVTYAPDHMPFCPVFIIGPPRSGSTLITQVLTDAFDIAYLCNGHCRFFGAPILADKLLHPLQSKRPSDFASNFGNTQQRYAPAECGEFWYRFFRRNPAYVGTEDVRKHQMVFFRKTLSALMCIHNKPILIKNLYTTLRIRPICKYLPQALFIIIQRDEVDNAHSILAARMKLYGDYRKWWSVPPPNVERLKHLPPEQQAVEQVRELRALVKRDISGCGLDAGRFLTVDYDDFCDDVHDQLRRIDRFFKRHGLPLRRLYVVPSRFKRVRKVAIDTDLYRKLLVYSRNVHPS